VIRIGALAAGVVFLWALTLELVTVSSYEAGINDGVHWSSYRSAVVYSRVLDALSTDRTMDAREALQRHIEDDLVAFDGARMHRSLAQGVASFAVRHRLWWGDNSVALLRDLRSPWWMEPVVRELQASPSTLRPEVRRAVVHIDRSLHAAPGRRRSR